MLKVKRGGGVCVDQNKSRGFDGLMDDDDDEGEKCEAVVPELNPEWW